MPRQPIPRIGTWTARHPLPRTPSVPSQVAQLTGTTAVHPGYGFLSENTDFAAALEGAGVAFVGPPASAIRSMGNKSEAKALMSAAGVPVVPGYHGADQADERLQAEADRIGYPVLVKAVLGGGGKGMKLAASRAEFMVRPWVRGWLAWGVTRLCLGRRGVMLVQEGCATARQGCCICMAGTANAGC